MCTFSLVGDKFKYFVQSQQKVMTLSEFECALCLRENPIHDVVIIGQGLCRQRISAICEVNLLCSP